MSGCSPNGSREFRVIWLDRCGGKATSLSTRRERLQVRGIALPFSNKSTPPLPHHGEPGASYAACAMLAALTDLIPCYASLSVLSALLLLVSAVVLSTRTRRRSGRRVRATAAAAPPMITQVLCFTD